MNECNAGSGLSGTPVWVGRRGNGGVGHPVRGKARRPKWRRSDRRPVTRRRPGVVLALGGVIGVGCGSEAEHAAAPLTLEAAAEATAAEVREAVETDGRGGAALGIFVGGEAVLVEGFGLADRESGEAASPEHLFRIGSITKPVTAMAMLALIEEGRARRGDPVQRFVPELSRVENAFEWAPGPTIFQLATMTGGLAREPANLPTYLVGAPEEWLSVVFRALEETRFEYEPGTKYQYSNIGYAVLGGAVERAAERPFMEFVSERLLRPLGMMETIFYPTEALSGQIAAGYQVEDDGSVDAETPAREHEGRGYKVPNGALYSTVADLGVFLRFLAGVESAAFDAVIPSEIRQDNLTRTFAAGDLSSGYGFGFMSRRLPDAAGGEFTAYGHGGSVAGYRAAAWIEPETEAAVVVLRNVGGDSVSVGDLASSALGRVVAAVRPRD